MVVAPRKTGDVVVPWRGRVCTPHPRYISHTPSSPRPQGASRDRSRTEKSPRLLSAQTREACACSGVTPSGPEPLSCHRTSQFANITSRGTRCHRACLIVGFARCRPVCTGCHGLVCRGLRPSSASVFFTHDNL